jgi:hypothetical protein
MEAELDFNPEEFEIDFMIAMFMLHDRSGKSYPVV